MNSEIPISYKLDKNKIWKKNYKIYDHLGSVRTAVNSDGLLSVRYDYAPFGEKVEQNDKPWVNVSRLSFIGKQKDFEVYPSSLADHGVRKYSDATGSFTSVDPLFEKYYGWSPYQYCGNNPVNMVDFSGLNWFITESGNTKWFDQQGDFSDTKTQETWTDMGEDFLKFNGSELTLYKSDKSSKSWPAVSGELKDGKTDPDSQWEKGGPIPEGTHYSVNPKEIQKWDNISFLNKVKSIFGGGSFPGGTSSWGDVRVPINPQKDNRGERTGGYFIHGGNTQGSRGCIDLWKYNKSFFNDFNEYKVPLPLIIIYP